MCLESWRKALTLGNTPATLPRVATNPVRPYVCLCLRTNDNEEELLITEGG